MLPGDLGFNVENVHTDAADTTPENWESLFSKMHADVGEPGENYSMITNKPFFGGAIVVGDVNFWGIQGQLQELQETALRIEKSVNTMMDAPQPLVVPISTLSPAAYEIMRPIFAVVEPVIPEDPDDDCEYIASFIEANVAASGDTVEEAVRFLKDRLIDKLVLLESLPKLGRHLQRQLHILRDMIRKCPEEAVTK